MTHYLHRGAAVLVFAWLLAGSAAAQSNGVLREVYSNISGVLVSDLTSNPAYPDNPTTDEVITSGFEAPVNVGDYYGQRLRALLVPPVTGSYVFYIASDDASELWLGTDDTPAGKRKIASVVSWTGSRVYQEANNYLTQKSASIPLTNGRVYYIEALMKEGAGGDNLAVTWQKPGDAAPAEGAAPIPNTNLRPYGLGPPQITAQPTNQTVVEGGVATFSAQVARKLGIAYQWLRNGTNIPGAVYSSYSLGPVRLADHGQTFRCYITNPFGSATSATATLSVAPDTTRPGLVSASSLGDSELVTVLFTETVDKPSAESASNYSLNNGASVLSASLLEDGATVVLRTSPLSAGPSYVLTVNSVRDLAQTPNVIATNSQRTFTLTFTPLDASYVTGSREPAGPCTRLSGLVISEIMYHPLARADGRNLEFVELYNSNPWPEDLTGHRLSGAADYAFPAGARLGPQSYLIVAASPSDARAVYGSNNVFGPLIRPGSPLNTTNVLDNGGGTIRLRDELDSVLVEAVYDDEDPYPASADGAGHSLILARPTYGAWNPKAWAASELVGGTPRTNDATVANPHRTVFLNELLAHTEAAGQDFIELYNYGTTAVDLSGCWLSDDPATNKHQIAAGTTLPALGFLAFSGAQLGFGLKASGETLYLRNPAGTRVIDALKFGDQERGVSTGRHPDGSPVWSRLSVATPGAGNARPASSDVVLNEIMCDPISGDENDEYVELHNRGTNTVDLGRWRLRGGISFTVPAGTLLGPGGYVVVGHNATNLMAGHPGLNPGNTLGDFDGRLANGGDRITLDKPAEAVGTNLFGRLVTNKIHVVVDSVAYSKGGRWGRWFTGGGSSLELTDARGDRRLAPSWADSDESAKSGWVTLAHTGLLDNGAMADPNQLHLFLQGEGECLLDNVEAISGGNNLVANGGFESGTNGWFFQGTHGGSSLETNQAFAGSRSLHVAASGRGDHGANRIRTALTSTPAVGSTATLRARVKWLAGHPELLLRLRGNYLDASTNILATRNLGSPGAANTRRAANAGPAITAVSHQPVLPAASQTVTVTARVLDPDGLSGLVLRYRVDPSSNYTAVAMSYRGAGFFSAAIPGQASGKRVAFYIQATDNHVFRAASRFPADAPARECLVGFGESVPAGSFGTYRVWCTQETVNRWTSREKNSDAPLDATFVYGNFRAVYNVEAKYKGSPWHTPGYSGPVGSACDYKLVFPGDDPMLGTEDMVLATIGNLGSDNQYQAEQAAYWIIRKLGNPYMHRRFVRLFFNAQQRQVLYEDACQPSGDTVAQFFPDDNDGNLHKVEDWFEFDDSGDNKLGNIDAVLNNYTTAGGAKKTARYRPIFRPRSYDSANEWTNLFALVDAMNAAQPEPYQSQVEALVDVDNFMRELAAQRIVGNWDSWGYARGKNTFIYKPRRGKWVILPWDIDFVFNVGGNGATDPLTGSNEAALDRFRAWPVFQRAYWQAFDDAVNGPLLPAVMNPMLDAKYQALAANNTGAGSPQGIKDYVAARRTYIQSQLSAVAAGFSVAGATSYATNRNLVTLTGTAPFRVRSISINGQLQDVTWTSVKNWTLRVALGAGLNQLLIQGLDSSGQAVTNSSSTLSITYTGPMEAPEDKIVINEIMAHPPVADAEYLELFNTSATNSFDLSRWRLDGLDGNIPSGTVIGPGELLVFARDAAVFAAVYGSNVPVAGQFSGRLENHGETVKLVKPGVSPEQDLVVCKAFYEAGLPWGTGADGGGFSLQLKDPAQDGLRAANWSGGASEEPWQFIATNGLFAGTNITLFLDGTGDVYVDDIALVPASGPLAGVNVLSNGGFEEPLAQGWFVMGTNAADSTVSLSLSHSGQASLHLVNVGAGSPTKALAQAVPAAASNTLCALSYWYRAGASGPNLFVRSYPGSSLRTSASLAALGEVRCTPGTNNSARAFLDPFPTLWLNEIQPANPGGPSDRFGHSHPWVELYNSGTNPVSLAGFGLATNYGGQPHWTFPPEAMVGPGQFQAVWLDGHPEETGEGEIHAGLTVPPSVGSLALYATNATQAGYRLVDHLNYTTPSSSRSYGNHPDGDPTGRQLFSILTPGQPNEPAAAALTVFINEWMADNTATLADPVDGAYSDWFELYNPAPEPVDLSGYFLSDDLNLPFQWEIPAGAIVPGRGHLLVWADGRTDRNTGSGDLHAPFQLNNGGEAIGLFGAGGLLVDAVTFGGQSPDVSQGRFPDGAAPIESLSAPTPRLPNLIAEPNSAPTLEFIADQAVDQGALLTFTAVAADSNFPSQTLTFSLDAGAPSGASVDPGAGVFSWLPAPTQPPGTYPVTLRVTDNGAPPLSAVRAFQIEVRAANRPPALASIGDRLVNETQPSTVTNSASDPDLPNQSLTFSLEAGAPTGMTIDPATGVLSWTPGEEMGPDQYMVTVRVTDDGVPPLSDTKGFTLTVLELNSAPALAGIASRTNAAGIPLRFTALASDADLPANSLLFSLKGGAPAGASIDPVSGLFTWTPATPGDYPITVQVADNGAPSLSAEQSFVVHVGEALAIERLELATADQAVIVCRTEPGRIYQLQWKPGVEDTQWFDAGDPVTASAATLTFTNGFGGQVQRFYRIAVKDPPESPLR